ncbi:MAG: PAS domain-containing sensor histidine kinase [Terracidiphilus sp.]|jgi:two-component system sensor histidine kinase FlrB
MLPSSHVVPINGANALRAPQVLADAFSEFISASTLLEASYRDLQQEVAHLGVELAERNAALSRSLAGNDRMRAALQQMIDSMPCGVLVLSTAERIVTINPEARRLLELKNTRVSTLRELSRVSLVDFESLVTGSNEELESELCVVSATGKRWLAISNRKLSGSTQSQDLEDASTQLQSIWILRDITTNKQAELEREAARRATVLAEISTILAHEIRNPLASMELFAGLIEQDRGETSEWISNLRAGIRTLSGTVNNVLSMNGGISPRLAPVNLLTCVQSGVEFVRPIAEQAGVSLTFHGADDTPSIEGNEDAIRQIILNLACNAIRHTAPGGSIKVSTRHSTRQGNTFALIKIADTGCGIPPELIDHLFEAGVSATGETPGLGLAVCKRLMTQHGGEIKVSSRVNEGSVFQLEFPAL